MPYYTISKVFPSDKTTMASVKNLLHQEGIRLDAHLDYTCAIMNAQNDVIATGSYFGNSLRCLCVSSAYQGGGFLNRIVSHLIDEEYALGNYHLFVYTKTSSAAFFKDLGFTEIVHIDNHISFLENKKTGFQDYLMTLNKPEQTPGKVAAIVINANPFTLGHQFLVEKAARENDWVHLFMVSEDQSLVPFSVRKMLIQEGLKHLDNIIFHETGPYLISQATFPAYFQTEDNDVIKSQALLDTAIFLKIAQTLQITKRYVGEEPTSRVTAIYNEIMAEQLQQAGILLDILPRKAINQQQDPINASTARQALKDSDWDLLAKLLPKTSLDYFCSLEAQPIIKKIQATSSVKHY
ncbi:TPA: [citrate (pro-3S)-lyase] ligase [Streptococcus pyogenes]|nr:[citrate (pro-3S)-lyase] ligase [Streptococcus pyogenes]